MCVCGGFAQVLIATRDGQLQLWNFNSGRRIHACADAFPPRSTRITALAQSPVVDVVAVGREDGTIVVHNIRADKVGGRCPPELTDASLLPCVLLCVVPGVSGVTLCCAPP